MYYRNPYQCIVPPYIVEKLAQSENPEVRAEAIAHLSADATVRAFRQPESTTLSLIPMASPNRQRLRLVYDAQQTNQLPGTLVRAEGQDDVSDEAVNEAYQKTDPQPANMSEIYTGTSDRGGVHINSGIPNRAFVLTAQQLGGNAWDVAGHIWYKTMLGLPENSQFIDCAEMTVQVAATDHGTGAEEAVRAGWGAVGIDV